MCWLVALACLPTPCSPAHLAQTAAYRAVCAVVAAEVEYLAAQLWQLPIMQQALEESEASGHTCASDHCDAPGCPGGGHGEEEEEQGEQRRTAHGAS